MNDENDQTHLAIHGESYMRWLAFYYLGRREHSLHELRQKLLAKGCDGQKVESLLVELVCEGYQSDARMTSMLIKEGLRKGYGKIRIYQTIKNHQLTTVASVDAIAQWIDEHQDVFADFMTTNEGVDDKRQVNGKVDWLAHAVAARVKKYGENIPTDAKQKAKQLRFLQYRGYDASVCFEALKHNSSSMAHDE